MRKHKYDDAGPGSTADTMPRGAAPGVDDCSIGSNRPDRSRFAERPRRLGQRPQIGYQSRLPMRALVTRSVVPAALLALAGTGWQCHRTDAPAARPVRKNVVLITLDGLRQDHLSGLGYARPTSPRIDWLAQRGLVYRTIVPTSCSTKGSLTSLFTALDMATHRIADHHAVLEDSYLTLAEVFRAAGYQTAAFVASPHLTAEMNYSQGFEIYEDFEDAPRFVPADRLVRGMGEFLRQRSPAAPFFLYAHFQEPHPPWLHPSPWLTEPELSNKFFSCTHVPSAAELATIDAGKRSRLVAKYDGAIRFADEQIGILVDQLRQRQLLEHTLIAIATDHGIELMERYSATHGYNPFDEVVRNFLVLYDGDGKLPSLDTGRIQGRIFDIGPTLMRRVGLDVPAVMQGVDLLNDAARLPEFAFTHCYMGYVVRSGDRKLVSVRFPTRKNRPPGMEDGDRLFDLRADPGERRDVKEQQPEAFARLQAALAGYRAEWEGDAPPAAPTPRLRPETRERMRALGYD